MTTTDWWAVRVQGPLAPYASGFFEELRSRGYTGLSARLHLRLVAHLSRWLEGEGLGAAELTSECVVRYCAARRRLGYTAMLTPRAVAPLLEFLRARDFDRHAAQLI